MKTYSKSEIDTSIGKVLREYRDKMDITQESLAEQLGISLKFISRIENGYNGVKTQTLINYMNILGVTPNKLYKPFLYNENIQQELEISEKISKLPDDKKAFLNSMIDLLSKFDD